MKTGRIIRMVMRWLGRSLTLQGPEVAQRRDNMRELGKGVNSFKEQSDQELPSIFIHRWMPGLFEQGNAQHHLFSYGIFHVENCANHMENEKFHVENPTSHVENCASHMDDEIFHEDDGKFHMKNQSISFNC